MKKIITLSLFLLISTSMILANLSYENRGKDILVEFENDDIKLNQESISKIFALPSRSVEIEATFCEIEVYSNDGDLIRNEIIDGRNKVEIIRSFVMRELFAHQLNIKITESDDTETSVLKKINFTVKPRFEVTPSNKISPAFLPLYRQIIENFDSSYFRNSQIVPSNMLIITRSNLNDYLIDLVQWKNAKGISTEVVFLDSTGFTSIDIKNYIQNAYNTWENPPDYILLVGDVDGAYTVPSFYISSANSVTDLPYTLLEGDDYFPEMLIGRLSVDSPVDLMTMVDKILTYEKTPYMVDTSWFKSALLLAGNYSSSPPIPITPVEVTKWLRDKMLDYGYTDIEEIYYPPNHFAQAEIRADIDDGVGFVTYRGWGDVHGWHYPQFKRQNIDQLSNGPLLPVIISIVCNTGNFANSVDPCFGEKWLEVGFPGEPKGAVAFVGPSYLYTSTKYNNAIFAGFFAGLLDEDIFTFSTAVLRGKLELFNNFPLNQNPGDEVEFYFHIYNILGDPSLTMWTTVPEIVTYDLPEEISIGANYLEIYLPEFDGGIATAIKEEEFIEIKIIENGYALLNLNSQTEGEIQVTLTKPNYHPIIETVNVISENIDVGLFDYETSSMVAPDEIIQLSLTLKNFGSQTANSVTAELSSDNQYVNILSSTANFGNIEPNATSTQNYELEILSNCPDNAVMQFDLNISTGATAKFELIASGLILEVMDVTIDDANGILEPGETADIIISVLNSSSVDATNLEASLTSLSTALQINSSSVSFGTINSGETGTGTFEVYVYPDCFKGRNIGFELIFEDENGIDATSYFNIEIGIVDNTAPTGPDNFGYFAYDSFDTDYDECPTYQWYEIDPDLGGSGQVIEMGDDESETIALPFDFKYYDVIFDSITVCSNGWISFETTWMTNFRNWNIPAALGPYGMVAPYWDDLIGETYIVNDTIYHYDMRICHLFEPTENIFIIEWNECVNNDDDVSVEKFQIVLFDPAFYTTADGNGVIQFNYHTINNPDLNGNFATVGIENLTQSDGILITFANIYPASATELANNLAIKFTTTPPDEYLSNDDDIIHISDFELRQNYPNPFNPSGAGRSPETTIFFTAENAENSKMEIFNIKGQKVKTLDLESASPSPFFADGVGYSISWNGTDDNNNPVTSGIYFYKLSAGDKTAVKKMLLLK